MDFSLDSLEDEQSGSDYIISGGYDKKADSNADSFEEYNFDYNDDSNGFEKIEDPSVKSRVKRMGS